MNGNKKAILMAILAAALFGISAPVSKLLIVDIPPYIMASLLYLGAGAGMLLVNGIGRLTGNRQEEAGLKKKDLPYILGMILLDIAAPVLLMLGLARTTSANASLLNNFEIVATSLIALLVFKEAVGKRMWLAILLITLSSVLLSFEDFTGFNFSYGSIFVLLACLCWGFENNCTRMLSLNNPLQIVVIKGFGSGAGALIIALALRQQASNLVHILLALLLGFVSYGLSIYFYIKAQRELGAARTSAYYAVAPFIGVFLSILIFGQALTLSFVLALLIMVLGAYFAAVEHHKHYHVHEEITHEHRHSHNDEHHSHGHSLGESHDESTAEEHSHPHTHKKMGHVHKHTPDMHHVHSH